MRDITNYRPISLVFHMHKELTQACITKTNGTVFVWTQTERTGRFLRKGYSIFDCIQTIYQLTAKNSI